MVVKIHLRPERENNDQAGRSARAVPIRGCVYGAPFPCFTSKKPVWPSIAPRSGQKSSAANAAAQRGELIDSDQVRSRLDERKRAWLSREAPSMSSYQCLF